MTPSILSVFWTEPGGLTTHPVVYISAEKIDEIVKRGLHKDVTWTEKAISLAYASGSRPIEVLSNASAQFKRGSNDNEMIQTGRSKAKGLVEYQKFMKQEIVKPINGMNWSQFQKLLTEVRSEVPQHTSSSISSLEEFKNHVAQNKVLSGKFVTKMGKMSQLDVPELKEAYGRGGIYVARKAFASATFDPAQGGTLLAHARKTLGHGNASMSLNYTNVNVVQPMAADNVRTADLIDNMNLMQQEIKSLHTITEIQEKEGGGKNVCNPTRVIRQTTQVRSFLNNNHEKVDLPRFYKKMRMTEEEKQERMEAAEEILEQNNIKITAVNLRNLGLGSKFTNRYRDRRLIGT